MKVKAPNTFKPRITKGIAKSSKKKQKLCKKYLKNNNPQNLATLLVRTELVYIFIGFASSSFTLTRVDSKVFWCTYKLVCFHRFSSSSFTFISVNSKGMKSWLYK